MQGCSLDELVERLNDSRFFSFTNICDFMATDGRCVKAKTAKQAQLQTGSRNALRAVFEKARELQHVQVGGGLRDPGETTSTSRPILLLCCGQEMQCVSAFPHNCTFDIMFSELRDSSAKKGWKGRLSRSTNPAKTSVLWLP